MTKYNKCREPKMTTYNKYSEPTTLNMWETKKTEIDHSRSLLLENRRNELFKNFTIQNLEIRRIELFNKSTNLDLGI